MGSAVAILVAWFCSAQHSVNTLKDAVWAYLQRSSAPCSNALFCKTHDGCLGQKSRRIEKKGGHGHNSPMRAQQLKTLCNAGMYQINKHL